MFEMNLISIPSVGWWVGCVLAFLAPCISTVANGNMQTITKSGYNATKGVRQPAPVPGSCKNFHGVAPKATGIINISCDADTASHGYIASPEEGVTVTQTGNQLAITQRWCWHPRQHSLSFIFILFVSGYFALHNIC